MTLSVLTYPLHDGYIHNWLVGHQSPAADITPIEFEDGWRYHRSDHDHLLRLPGQGAYAFIELHSEQAVEAEFALSTDCEFAVWVNGAQAVQGHRAGFTTLVFSAALVAGANRLLIRGRADCALALRWIDAPDAAQVQVRSHTPDLERRQKFERVFAQAFLERDVFRGSDQIILHWSGDYDERCWLTARLQTLDGRIYAESTKMLDGQTRSIGLGYGHNPPEGPLEVLLMPRAREYYAGQRYERRLPLRVVKQKWSGNLYGTDEGRKREVLQHAAGQTVEVPVWQASSDDRLAQLHALAMQGFFEAPDAITTHIVALMHLVDLAEDDELRQMAAILLDKLLFGLAINSFQGIYAASRTHPRQDPTTPIMRLLWGLGTWNEHIAAPVSLALTENYQVPTLIQAIALDQHAAMWSRQQQAGGRRATFRTPDYMLTAGTDHWRAIFGPRVIVQPALTPWSAEVTVHQWQDTLIYWHHISEDSPLGECHMQFPCADFDEIDLRDLQEGWVFGRVGDGYLALTSSSPLGLSPDRRALVSDAQSVWCVQMGRAEVDFEAFQANVRARSFSVEDDVARFTTLRGTILESARGGGLRIDGQPEPPYRHFENPYCVMEHGDPVMEIRYREYAMQLQFAPDSEIAPQPESETEKEDV